MKIPYFCCIGAELKRYEKDFDFMNQVYLYKVPTDDNIEEVLSEDYFKAISDSVLQDDLVYIYEASKDTLHSCRFDKQDGHITAVPLASDETLTGAVTTIIRDNLTPGKLVVSDSDGKIAVSETDADELAILHGLKATTEELNYSHGVTANIQDQLDSTVHKAGTETITGDKTFTKPISFSMSLTQPVDVISITDTDLHSLITLSCDYASSGMFTDLISHNYSSNYDAIVRLFNNDMGAFYLELTGSGNAENLSLSGADTSISSTIIPTKGWANNPGLNNIVHKTGNESISGNKTFAGTTTFNGVTALSNGKISAAPTDDNDITNKKYVDTIASVKANKNMDNLTSTGTNIGNWSSNVTNCITEIPQDIKLELSNGTLTLKVGSKVYVPNGAGVFDTFIVETDLSRSTWGSGSADLMVAFDTVNSTWGGFDIPNCYSGPTAPTGATNMLWYDTTNNKVKQTSNSGSTWSDGWTLPIFIISRSSGAITSIDQVFNGFGYIGSTVFVLPGVKGLIPDGRNADGTLKNTSWTTSDVITRTFVSTDNGTYVLGFDGEGYSRIATRFYQYDESENIQWNETNLWSLTLLGNITLTNGVINSLPVRTTFHALDYNDYDSEYMAHNAMPSNRYENLTLGASGASYTAPADGYIYLNKSATAANQSITIINDSNGMRTNDSATGSGIWVATYLPVSKGQPIRITYTTDGTTNVFRFIYANGVVQ